VKDFALDAIADGNLFELKFDKVIPRRHFCIITGRNNPISTAAKELINMLHVIEPQLQDL
jgi:hypothetical protein